MSTNKTDDQYSEQETERRAAAALRAAFRMRPKPQSERNSASPEESWPRVLRTKRNSQWHYELHADFSDCGLFCPCFGLAQLVL
jgi:hypothetical protein